MRFQAVLHRYIKNTKNILLDFLSNLIFIGFNLLPQLTRFDTGTKFAYRNIKKEVKHDPW
jgi:hypothetical protein